jgi:hypothetical protein
VVSERDTGVTCLLEEFSQLQKVACGPALTGNDEQWTAFFQKPNPRVFSRWDMDSNNPSSQAIVCFGNFPVNGWGKGDASHSVANLPLRVMMAE